MMSRKKAYLIILLSLVLAVAVPLSIRTIPRGTRTHHIALKAEKYGYSPSRIVVNKGDTIVFEPTSKDVTHGFLLDGYPLDFIIKPKGPAYLKYHWKDDDGKIRTDWDKTSKIEFVADKSGKFTFRCTRTCGNLHPFMTGELIVRPNSLYHLFISLSVWMTISLLLFSGSGAGSRANGLKRVNVLEVFPWLKRVIKSRSFQFLVILPNFVVFYLFILSALWGSPVGNRNIAIIFVWILWWFVLKAIMVPLGGRVWCLMCPLPAPAEWLSRLRLTAVKYLERPFRGLHHAFAGLQKDWPQGISNIWLQNIIFMILISFAIILITRPVATAIVFLAIFALTILLALIYRRRVFCLYVCPVGGSLSTYSMAAMTEVRAVDTDVCKRHKEKSCHTGTPGGWACPWGQYVGNMDRNNYCGMCTECIKSCPKDNVGIFIRPYGSDRVLKGYDEMFNVIIMLVVAFVFSVTMLGPWGIIKTAANVTESRQIMPYFMYLASVWGLALLVIPGLFVLTAKGANRFAGRQITDRAMMLQLAFILIPLGMFSWIAFSLSPVMVNYNYILSVLSDPFGFGWDLFGTAGFPFKPFYPEWIPLLQGLVLLAGLYFGLSRGLQAMSGLVSDNKSKTRGMILPALFALLVINLFLKLFLG